MEILFSVENFEESNGNYREINSPRTLEACLRAGLDPSELYPKPISEFNSKKISEEMIKIKYQAFQKKREGTFHLFSYCSMQLVMCIILIDKKNVVRTERNSIIQYALRKMAGHGTEGKDSAAASSPGKQPAKAGLIELVRSDSFCTQAWLNCKLFLCLNAGGKADGSVA
jgi:hypothetical protein